MSIFNFEVSTFYEKGPDTNDGRWWNLIYAITLDLPLGEERRCTNHVVTVNIKGVNGVFFKLDRFSCYAYNHTLSPMFNSHNRCSLCRGKSNRVTFNMPCEKVWGHGEYTLLIFDEVDNSLIRIPSSIDMEALIIEVFCPSRPIGSIVYYMIRSYEEAQEFSKEELITESTDVGFVLNVE